ncbi:AlpA family transcriptional regulator [Novosphingobium sp. KN65.2]|uniref:helix-turn-helix transcriptional regulator n=1 Tax=Novosphingobium sp. KN65.2 TaxID=1478134 RepID=UPI0005E7B0CA|nr:hypothetical protein [Novosphingobium sp. KN65.2]CDO35040.1 hypothetical protein SPHV1_2180052 [Novosphingobium sp. KN65.2]
MNAPAAIPLDRSALPDWPRLMRETMAAAYLGISKSMLRDHGPASKHIGRCAVWDRRDLDRWADALGTNETDPQPLDHAQREAESESVADRVRRRLANGPN